MAACCFMPSERGLDQYSWTPRKPCLPHGAIPALLARSRTLSAVVFRSSRLLTFGLSTQIILSLGRFSVNPVLCLSIYLCQKCATPPPLFYRLASVDTRVLPSPNIGRLGQWELVFYEAASTFTLVTTRIVARPPFCGLCRWAREGNVSITPCHPS
jgi:hypothetical protein